MPADCSALIRVWQVGYGPIALAIGVPMAAISVKQQLKILGLPVGFIESNQMAAEAEAADD